MKCQFKARQLCIVDKSLLLRVGRWSGGTVTGLGWDRTQRLGLQLGKVRVWVRVGGLGFRLGLDSFETFYFGVESCFRLWVVRKDGTVLEG